MIRSGKKRGTEGEIGKSFKNSRKEAVDSKLVPNLIVYIALAPVVQVTASLSYAQNDHHPDEKFISTHIFAQTFQ